MTDRMRVPDPGDPVKHVHIFLGPHGEPTMVWERLLSEEEIEMLARDPYAVFRKGESDG